MSVYATLDGAIGPQLASNQGWADFGSWVDDLDDDQEEVLHLREHGWCQHLPELSKQLKASLQTSKPDDDVASIVQDLLDAIDGAEVLTITDGMAPDGEHETQEGVNTDGVTVDLPDIRQRDTFDCGAAALLAVCQHFGVGPTDDGAMIVALGTDRKDGTRPKEMVDAAQRFGLKHAVADRCSLSAVIGQTDLGRPVILCIQAHGTPDERDKIQSGHYVVAIGHQPGKVWVQDPSVGRVLVDDAELAERWKDKDADGVVYEQWGLSLWK